MIAKAELCNILSMVRISTILISIAKRSKRFIAKVNLSNINTIGFSGTLLGEDTRHEMVIIFTSVKAR